jgi:hypothetical protein
VVAAVVTVVATAAKPEPESNTTLSADVGAAVEMLTAPAITIEATVPDALMVYVPVPPVPVPSAVIVPMLAPVSLR